MIVVNKSIITMWKQNCNYNYLLMIKKAEYIFRKLCEKCFSGIILSGKCQLNGCTGWFIKLAHPFLFNNAVIINMIFGFFKHT